MTKLAVRKENEIVYTVRIGNIQAHQTLIDMLRLSGCSQRTFARVMGIHEGTLSKYLSGHERTPRVIALAAVFAAMCHGVVVQIPNPLKELAMVANGLRKTI